jgi:ubiquinol-cytochrome c reductase cytochrome b subunit
LINPLHIKPEWYFLFAYAILRSIPRKLGGVIALLISILILIFLLMTNFLIWKGTQFFFFNKILFWFFVNLAIILTWIGGCPVESPYVIVGQFLTILYFFYFFIFSLIQNHLIKLKI